MSGDSTPVKLGDGWPVAAPDRQGINATILSGIGPRFEEWKEACAHAVVVAHRGALVYEHYFTGEDWCWTEPLGAVVFDAGVKHDLKSITKSVTSLLVGAALDRGWIADIDTPVVSYFPEHADLCAPGWERITLAHLLTMSAGLAWTENIAWSNPANNERQMDDASDPYQYVLEQSIAAPPGQLYNYCGGAPTLLQGVMQRTSGKGLDLLAREALFEPLALRMWSGPDFRTVMLEAMAGCGYVRAISRNSANWCSIMASGREKG
jgi:hypothetical protein